MISLLQNRYRTDSVLHFFDLSIVLTFNKEMERFMQVLPSNVAFYQRNGIEVILVLTEYNEEKVTIEHIKKYPFINWKVIINRQENKLYNRSKAINAGIQRSTMRYVLIMPPESEIYTDVIYQFRETLEYYTKHYVVGQIESIVYDKEHTIKSCPLLSFGSIMVEKCFMEQIGGYDENLIDWRADFDLRVKLEMIGVRKLFVGEALLANREKKCSGNSQKNTKSQLTKGVLKLQYPSHINPIRNSLNDDFDKICYDWQTDRFNLIACNNYLNRFVHHTELTGEMLNKKRHILILAPARNESEIISGFIEHMSRFCDGIIFLDDGSSDDTYNLMAGEKVLLKVQKKNSGFDDISNRNILLHIASFFNTEWLLFMDIDEQFDNRYCDIKSLTQQDKFDVCIFNFVHVWNSMDTYNAAYPGSKKGIVEICRMFRSKGHLQINTSKTLHFPSVPYYTPLNIVDKSILVLHKGYLSQEARIRKYLFYQRADENRDQQNYEYILDNYPVLGKVSDISI